MVEVIDTAKPRPHTRRITGILIVALVTLSAPAAFADTWANVTVITLDGWEYSEVTVTCTPGDSYVILINTARARKLLELANIKMIRNDRGEDITLHVLSCGTLHETMEPISKPSPPRTTPPVSDAQPDGKPERRISKTPIIESEREVRHIVEARFRFSPTVGVGYSTTSGDWFEGFTSGILLDIIARFGVKNDLFMGFAFRRQELGVEDDWQSICFYDEYDNYVCASAQWDVVLKEMYFIVGYMTTPRKFSTPIGYAEFGVGAIQHDIKLTLSYQGIVESDDSDESKLTLMWGGGVLFPLNRRIGLDLEAHFRWTGDFGSSYPYREDITGFIFGFRGGIVFFLGGS